MQQQRNWLFSMLGLLLLPLFAFSFYKIGNYQAKVDTAAKAPQPTIEQGIGGSGELPPTPLVVTNTPVPTATITPRRPVPGPIIIEGEGSIDASASVGQFILVRYNMQGEDGVDNEYTVTTSNPYVLTLNASGSRYPTFEAGLTAQQPGVATIIVTKKPTCLNLPTTCNKSITTFYIPVTVE